MTVYYKYYLVTGMNNGVAIEPYAIAVSNDAGDCTLEAFCSNPFNPRYLEPITKEEYERLRQ